MKVPLSKDEQIFLSSVYIDTRYPPDAGLLPDGEPVKSDAKIAVDIAIGLIGIMALWLGIMKKRDSQLRFQAIY